MPSILGWVQVQSQVVVITILLGSMLVAYYISVEINLEGKVHHGLLSILLAMVVVAGLGVGTAHGQVRSRRELGLLGDKRVQGRGIFAEGWGEGNRRRVAVA